MVALVNKEYTPDILETISNLSSDEVFTPPDLANQLLDTLPEDLWKNPDIKIIDPALKTGVFLREASKRLMEGLSDVFPDEKKRRNHIFKNMLFGIAITELTALMSRRTIYYSKDASSSHSVVKFKNTDGNVFFSRTEHTFIKRKCSICNGNIELERGKEFENYAYQFLHDESSYENMKFDVVVGNPPYQLEDGGAGRSASPIYHLFVNQAFKLKPRYVSMIIPSRWFSGGKGLDPFRDQMLKSKNFKTLVDIPNSNDVFPTVKVEGGVCYFLWDKNYEGKAKIVTKENNKIISETNRYLGQHGDVFIRYNEAVSILEKVKNKSNKFCNELAFSRKPFGLATNFKQYSENKKYGYLKLYYRDGIGYVDKKHITTNQEIINKYKVLITKAYGISGNFPQQIIGKPKIAEPGSVCTETYIVCGVFDTEVEAKNYVYYLSTKFSRFLIHLRKITQDFTKDRLMFVPYLKMNKEYSDKDLFKKFNIDNNEIKFIEEKVKEMVLD